MRIVHINVNWGQGGPGSIAKDISDVLIRHGHQCLAAFGRASTEIGAEGYQIDTWLELTIHTVLSRLFGNEGCYSWFATRRLIRKIERFQPDIVQLHTMLGHYINFKLLFGYLKKKRICTVWTIHDCSPFTGHCISFDRIQCEKWMTHCHHCPLWKEYPYSFFFDKSSETYEARKKLYGSMDNLHIVVPSHWMGNMIAKSFLKERDRYVFHNGINLESFKPVQNDIREKYHLQGKTILLAVSNVWNEMKGFNVLLDLAALLDDSFALIVVGNKDESRVPERIISIPPVKCEDLVSWYSAADIFINPTLGDNFPTVNIEALSCGTPVVTFDTGGSAEAAGDKCGCVVREKTAEGLYKKILECRDRKITKEECLERAESFSRGKTYLKYIELYEELLRGKE